MDHFVEFEDVCKYYQTGSVKIAAADHMNFYVDKGEFCIIVGPSGAGKTTLAKGIMGLTAKPYGKIKSGKILYEGKNLLEMDKKQLRRIRGEHISMIFQDPMTSLNPVMTVGDQIAEAIRNHDKLSRVDAAKKAAEILELVGIPSARGSEYPHQFSGGQRQRLTIARALVGQPKILILDDSASALDYATDAKLRMAIARETQNMTVIIVSQRANSIRNADKIIVLDQGHVMGIGTHRELLNTCPIYKEICLSQMREDELE